MGLGDWHSQKEPPTTHDRELGKSKGGSWFVTEEHQAAQLHHAVRRQLQGTGGCKKVTTTHTPAHATFIKAAKQSPGDSLDLCATITTPGLSRFYDLQASGSHSCSPFPSLWLLGSALTLMESA